MTEAVTVAPKDTSNLTRWTIWLLYAEIGISVVAIFSNYLEYQFLENIRNGLYAGNQPQAEADGATSDSRQMVIGITEIVLAVLTGIIILRWIYFANKNLRSLGASGLRFSPG
jgi:hypothetical protein